MLCINQNTKLHWNMMRIMLAAGLWQLRPGLLVKPRGVHLQGGLHPHLTEGNLPCEPGNVLPPCPLNGALEVCSHQLVVSKGPGFLLSGSVLPSTERLACREPGLVILFPCKSPGFVIILKLPSRAVASFVTDSMIVVPQECTMYRIPNQHLREHHPCPLEAGHFFKR